MSDRIKAAFDAIHAAEATKQRTREYLRKTVYEKAARKTSPLRRLRPLLAAACLVLALLAGGSYLYRTPTAFISVDINPSLELGINRFDRVVSVEAYNDDGQALADALYVQNLDYRDALEQILTNPNVVAYLSNGTLSLTVASENESRCAEILQTMEDCTTGHRNVHCHAASANTMEEAHSTGMSVGKYEAYLQLRELDPTITPEEVQGMTMREINRCIEAYVQGTDWTPAETPDDAQCEAEGSQHGHGFGGNGNRHGAAE